MKAVARRCKGIRRPLALAVTLVFGLAALGSANAEPFTLRKIALEGEPAPGGAGSYSTFFSGASIGDGGDIGFVVALDVDPPNQAVYVLRPDGSVDSVLASDPPPPELGGSYSYLGAPSLNAAGDYAFHVGIPFKNSWLLGSEAGLEVIASVGDPVPGLPGSTYADNPDSVFPNDAGQVLLGTRLDTAAGSQTALLLIDDSGVDVVAIKGDAAPTPVGSTFTVINDEASMNAAGTVVFFGHTDLTTEVGSRGVFARLAGTLVPIALERELAPVGVGRTFSFASNPTPRINAAGHTVFYASLQPYASSANQGLFLHDGTTTSPLVLTGDLVPGSTQRTFSTFGRPQIGWGDVVVFLAYSYDEQEQLIQGLYRLCDGRLTTIVETGESLPGAGGAVLDALSYWSLSMNASGAVLFKATLSDGRSGAYLATPGPSAVPSLGPGALGALIAVLAAAGAMGSRRTLTLRR